VIDAFIDTNVLLYAASDDQKESAKSTAARVLLENDFGTSVQVLQEFYVNATGKLAASIPSERLERILKLLQEQPIVPITPELFEVAVEIKALCFFAAVFRRHFSRLWDLIRRRASR
jgi:predicted nucleic acid-binding protein